MNGPSASEPDDLPIVIGAGETIVRAIKTPAHYDETKKRLKNGAFRPPAGESGLSAMRQLIGDDQCKRKAQEICGGAYRGLAAIKAEAIRAAGSTVTDSRDVWFGHADIDHGIVLPANEPPDPDLLQRLTDRCRALVANSQFRDDGDPDGDTWQADTLAL
jgi:hypothetical protein